MTLAPGTRIGPYEIVGHIGAGGMGEVWKAKDTRLGRDVAIKVLPADFAEDAGLVRRFHQEAKVLASLNHPNVVQIFEAGEHEGSPFLVMELLDGETLRARLHGKLLTPKRAAEITREAALGLSAAHEKGILHRDLKPENLFLMKDGRVKVLDFGLAKVEARKPIGQESETRAFLSEPGTLVGTSGYMSPEQVRGETLDPRSDLFSLGVILWEMLTGKRPFTGDSSIEVMHSILKEDPPELDETLKVPPALERILRNCLQKEPTARFHSAHDLAFALDSLSSPGSGSSQLSKVQAHRPGWGLTAVARTVGLWVLVLALGVLAWFRQWPPFRPPSQPTFKRLTYHTGEIRGARFSPDGREAIFDGAWDGGKAQIYATRLDTLEEKPLGIQDAKVMGLTQGGDLSVYLGPVRWSATEIMGTLGKAPLGGTAPKPLQPGVLWADQSPSGSFAVVRYEDDYRLDYPIGTVIAQGNGEGFFSPRFSKDGRYLAWAAGSDTAGMHLVLQDLATGKQRRLTRAHLGIWGVAWKGPEIWFTAGDSGWKQSLHAVTLDGHERVVMELPGRFVLHDVTSEGRALMAQEDARLGILLWGPGDAVPRDLSRQDWGYLQSLSPEGKRIVSFAMGNHPIGEYDVLLTPVDGPPQILGKGFSSALSPDGAWVASQQKGDPPSLMLYPTGPGQERRILLPWAKGSATFGWTRDGKSLLVAASEPGKRARIFLLPLEGGPPRPLTAEGVYADTWGALDLSPDGRWFHATSGLCDLQNPAQAPVPIKGSREGDSGVGWSADSRRLYILEPGPLPLKVSELDPATGTRKPFRTFAAEGYQGLWPLGFVCRMTPDGRTFAVTYFRNPSTLYLVEGLK